MPRPIHASISHSALAHNLDLVRRRLAGAASGPSPRVWAIIKANAYGHGTQRAVAGFAAADGLAMLDPMDAVRCRAGGWTRPIMLIEGIFDQHDARVAGEHRLTLVIHDDAQIALLENTPLAHPVDVFLKLNTGMNRLGFAPGGYRAAYARLAALRDRDVIGLLGHMTHFYGADTPTGVAGQMAVFRQTTAGLPGPVSVANSAASLRYPDVAGDWARPGIALYGASPFDDQSAESLGLRPAMALRSALIGVQHVPAGGTVGYGARFTADVPTRVGVVACGYADGYPRHAGTGTPVVVDGVRTRLVGRVSMDMLAVDLSPVPQAVPGSPVTLWGADGLSVDEVAAAAGTIGYELLCAVAPRVDMRSED